MNKSKEREVVSALHTEILLGHSALYIITTNPKTTPDPRPVGSLALILL